MPNKTIYVRDADLPVWNKAQQELGESISSIVIDCLKERLETSQARKSGRIDEIEAMTALLAEINDALNLDVELHPSWRYPILGQNTLNHGFKLHRKKANPDRIMSLVVWPLDFDESGQAAPMLKERIKAAVQEFWNGQATEAHKFFDLAK